MWDHINNKELSAFSHDWDLSNEAAIRDNVKSRGFCLTGVTLRVLC